jgi:hypothetical protein
MKEQHYCYLQLKNITAISKKNVTPLYNIRENEIIHNEIWAFVFSYHITRENQRFRPVDEIFRNSVVVSRHASTNNN